LVIAQRFSRIRGDAEKEPAGHWHYVSRNFLFGLENGTMVHPSDLFATL
jgi:hypothetical protein